MASLPSTNKSLVVKVRRGIPELITPARSTPHEFKQLSDIDELVQNHTPLIQFYRHVPSMEGKDPVDVIKKAVAETLVFYYPFAGRLREGANKKLVVECNGEGILFMEGDAEVTIDQFGDPILLPVSCLEEFIFSVPNSVDGMLNSPSLLMQVTRFRCGGFAITANISHVISDGPGAMQFVTAIGEMARGAQIPSTLPVWERHIFSLPNLPHKEDLQQEPEQDSSNDSKVERNGIINQSFFIGTSEMSTIRSLVTESPCRYSSFELLTAYLWKYRTIASQVEPEKKMYLIFAVNSRGKFSPPIVPSGYYGNGLALALVIATAGEICESSLMFLVELIKKAKEDVLKEFMQHAKRVTFVIEMMKTKGIRCCAVSDLRYSGMEKVDYGWGKAAFAGVAMANQVFTSYTSHKNKKGENEILVSICLPLLVMKRFVKELKEGLNKEISVI